MREEFATQLLKDAARFAVGAHEGQVRKIEETPYVGHVFAVAGLVADYGGTAEQIAAALLHDVVEDTPYSISDIRSRFGETVAELVAGMTEQKDLGPYRDRKREYAQRLAIAAPKEVALVALADKTHNLETSLRHLAEGHAVFRKFPSIVWYNKMLLEALDQRVTKDSPEGTRQLLERYRDAVNLIRVKAKDQAAALT